MQYTEILSSYKMLLEYQWVCQHQNVHRWGFVFHQLSACIIRHLSIILECSLLLL